MAMMTPSALAWSGGGVIRCRLDMFRARLVRSANRPSLPAVGGLLYGARPLRFPLCG